MRKPWEEVGRDVSMSGSLADAMTEANVLFNVSVKQGFFVSTTGNFADDYRQAEGHFYIVRDDINAVLGAAKTRFKPLQNADAFAFFQPFIDDGICKIDTIGSFGKGQKIWILAEIIGNRYTVVEGDDISLYLILVNAHDGSTSVMVGIVPIRIVCSNMFNMFNRSKFQVVKFKHTGDPIKKLRQIYDFVNKQLESVEEFIGQLKILAEVWPTPEKLDEYFRLVSNITDAEGASTKANNKIKRLHELFIQGQGNQKENVRGTWYAAYNAISEFLNYETGRSAETRLISLWFGVNNNINHKALTTALQYATEGGVLDNDPFGIEP